MSIDLAALRFQVERLWLMFASNPVLPNDATKFLNGAGAYSAPPGPADGSITLAKMADLATQRVIGRNTGSTGVPEAVTLAQLMAWAGPAGTAWTPTIGGTTSESGQVYSVQEGYSLKIGRLVFITGSVRLSTLGTITGNVCIKGLPYTVAAVSLGAAGIMPLSWLSMTTSYVYMQLQTTASSTQLQVQGITAANTAAIGANLAQADLSATTAFRFGGVYEASS